MIANATIAAGTTVSIQVYGFTVPQPGTALTSFTIETSTKTPFYKIDKITGSHTPSLKCEWPCNDCVSESSTGTTPENAQCTSCYTTGTTLIYLDLVAKKCVDVCPTHYFIDIPNK
jgi:hypothetical protein